jgi:Fic family protein
MTESHNERRDSRAFEPELITDPKKKAEAEARNGLRQYDAGMQTIQCALDRGGPFKLSPSLVLGLHREALAGISHYAGLYRPAGVEIEQSKHTPPGAHLVPELVEEMCDYVNDNWSGAATHLGAYVMWRLNWIHPFADGNGRTSRILSYVVLSIRAGSVLPGTPTIPDQITQNRNPYFQALDAADAAYANGKIIDVSKMEELLTGLLAQQLLNLHQHAVGRL